MAPSALAMEAPDLRVMVAFRASGWQWPLRPGDVVCVYAADLRPIAELPAELVLDLIRHHLWAVALQGRVAARVQAKPPLPAPASLAPPRLPAARGRKLRGRPC